MKPENKPRTRHSTLGYLIEECGEVLHAVGKSERWGLRSTNPELPPEQQEMNGDWILRELLDLERAIALTREVLAKEGFIAKSAENPK